MTSFAKLAQHEAGLTKVAAGAGMFRKLHGLMRDGIWKRVAQKTKPKSFWGRTSRLFHNPVTDRSTLLNKGLMGYGLTGVVAPMAGYDLPGSSMALNASTPVLGAMMTAPSLIGSWRASRPGNQARMKEDALTGARSASSDMLTLGQMDSRYLTQPGLAHQFLKENDPDTARLAEQYRTGSHKPMSGLRRLQSVFENPQALIDEGVDSRIYNMMAPSGMLKFGSFGSAVGKGFSHAFPWLFPALSVGAIGHSIFSDKPYDETRVRSRGYAGAQAKIQKGLDGMSGMERFALRMDPTLLASRLEKQLPGTIGTWEQQHGRAFQPGLISSMVGSWKKGSTPSYYQYDINGNRHYV